MSMEHAKAFYELLANDSSVRDDAKGAWDHLQAVAQKHGLDFTHAEYFDHVHEVTGMSKVGKSDDHDDTDTCVTFVPSEAPGF